MAGLRSSARVVGAIALLASCTSSTGSSPTTEPIGGATTTVDGRTSVPTSTSTSTSTGTPTDTSVEPDRPVPRELVDGFDDHTISRIADVDDFDVLARAGVHGQRAVKFAIPEMSTSDDVRWFDSNFYDLHDEWYWFRLLNGRAVPGFDTEPVRGRRFGTVDEIVAWARQQATLPLDLRLIDSQVRGERLYSPRFYDEAIQADGRAYGIGTLIHFPDAADGRDHWLLELEFGDVPTPDDLQRFFSLIAATVPTEIGDALEWVVRSPGQEATARRIESEQLPLHDRIVRFSDLATPGDVAVYNPGIAAGRLLVVDGEHARLAEATEDDIIVVEHPPDWLPPAAALITSDLQTPLAHVNLLARNRGIPNVSIQGVLDDPGIAQAARIRSYAVVYARPDGSLDVSLITKAEYDAWAALGTPTPIAVPPVDLPSLPVTVDLVELANTVTTEAEVDAWRPIIGGKAAGFLDLIATPGVELPPDPLAITVAPYLRHLRLVRPELDAMMADTEFQRSAAVRFLYLEGYDDYVEAYPNAADVAVADRLRAAHPDDTALGRILHGGGFKRLFRDAAMNGEDLEAITDAITTNYDDLAITQGIRFRSSSSVEDIEGFNGAGLYDSNTGFADPSAAGEDDDKTFEEAIKKTWASYWGFEAFEERRLERVSHVSGEMAVLVHPRFDDDLELDNGVITYTLLPGGGATATVNAQHGAVSVANPDPDAPVLPEIVLTEQSDGGDLIVRRVAPSSLDPQAVLDDDEIAELVEQVDAATRLWRERINAGLPEAQRISTLTLDVEFKHVDDGWPALRTGTLPARLVIKQARTLEPGLRGLPADAIALPIPRDVLARARSIVDRCGRVEILTDPLALPDMGYAERPLVVSVDPAPGCVERTIYASPDEYLIDLLESGSPLSLTGT